MKKEERKEKTRLAREETKRKKEQDNANKKSKDIKTKKARNKDKHKNKSRNMPSWQRRKGQEKRLAHLDNVGKKGRRRGIRVYRKGMEFQNI